MWRSVPSERFTNQALCALHLSRQGRKLENRVYGVPEEIDKRVARLKLRAMGIRIDTLTREQQEYLASWEIGT